MKPVKYRYTKKQFVSIVTDQFPQIKIDKPIPDLVNEAIYLDFMGEPNNSPEYRKMIKELRVVAKDLHDKGYTHFIAE